MKCSLMPYAIKKWKEDFPDAPPLTDDDGLFCPLRKDGVCTYEGEPEIHFNLSGVIFCVPHSKVTRRVLVGDDGREIGVLEDCFP